MGLALVLTSDVCSMAITGIAGSRRGLDPPLTPFKFVEVLAALGRPDAALAVLRARAHVSHVNNVSSDEAFREAQTALAVRLQCGVFLEACSEVSLTACLIVSVSWFGCLSALLVHIVSTSSWHHQETWLHDCMSQSMAGFCSALMIQVHV